MLPKFSSAANHELCAILLKVLCTYNALKKILFCGVIPKGFTHKELTQNLPLVAHWLCMNMRVMMVRVDFSLPVIHNGQVNVLIQYGLWGRSPLYAILCEQLFVLFLTTCYHYYVVIISLGFENWKPQSLPLSLTI